MHHRGAAAGSPYPAPANGTAKLRGATVRCGGRLGCGRCALAMEPEEGLCEGFRVFLAQTGDDEALGGHRPEAVVVLNDADGSHGVLPDRDCGINQPAPLPVPGGRGRACARAAPPICDGVRAA